SASLRQRRRGSRFDRPLSRLLQRKATAFESRRHDTRSSLLQPAAPPLGSLTLAQAPLIDAGNLFRQPEPPQRIGAGLYKYKAVTSPMISKLYNGPLRLPI